MLLGEREFTLRTRSDQGNTPKLNYWGAESEYGVLKNVLLVPVENYKWLNTSSVSKKSLRRQHTQRHVRAHDPALRAHDDRVNSIGHGLPAIIPLSSHGIIAGHCKDLHC